MNAGLMQHKVGVSVASVRRAGALQAVDYHESFLFKS
jgi:hypothetical protein